MCYFLKKTIFSPPIKILKQILARSDNFKFSDIEQVISYLAGAVGKWLLEETHILKAMSLNLCTIYLMYNSSH